MRRYANSVLDGSGKPVDAGTVTVKYAAVPVGTGANGTLYSDEAGLVALANPVSTDSFGRFGFYVQDGDYDLVIFKAAVINVTVADVSITDPKRHNEVTIDTDLYSGLLNAIYDRAAAQFNRVATGKSAYGHRTRTDTDTVEWLRAAAGANPITWTTLMKMLGTPAASSAVDQRLQLFLPGGAVRNWLGLWLEGESNPRFHIRYVPANNRVELMAGVGGTVGDYLDFVTEAGLVAVTVNEDRAAGASSVDFRVRATAAFPGSDLLMADTSLAQVQMNVSGAQPVTQETFAPYARRDPTTGAGAIDLNTVFATAVGLSAPNITGQSGNVSGVRLVGTALRATAAVVIPVAATLVVDQAPYADGAVPGNVTLTQALALWIKAGIARFDDKLDFRGPTQTTVGAAGGASAPPATPTGYLRMQIAGVERVMAFYAQA